jgi:hypothetical protein
MFVTTDVKAKEKKKSWNSFLTKKEIDGGYQCKKYLYGLHFNVLYFFFRSLFSSSHSQLKSKGEIELKRTMMVTKRSCIIFNIRNEQTNL